MSLIKTFSSYSGSKTTYFAGLIRNPKVRKIEEIYMSQKWRPKAVKVLSLIFWYIGSDLRLSPGIATNTR